ncbi:hypothetical protein Ddye_001587 [Dipteronia dyeriana]|uniref:Uncharacterized protein n=1 Tax=Dipteronia dyeriana TaxID=168575 RepID=A0AAE0CU48_9ROSI|nr:hypothetical protein Ddye_001587 [Dipteronia dyeriana]
MDRVRIVISYNGRRKQLPDENQRYLGSDNQGLYVSKNLSYDELVSIVQTIVKFDENKYSAELQSLSIVPGTTCRTFIRNNDDVKFMLGEDKVILQVCVSLIERPAGGVIGEDILDRDNTQQFRSSGGSNQLFTERSEIDGRENICSVPPEVAAHDNRPGPQFDDVFGCQIEMNGRQYNHQSFEYGKFLYFFMSIGASLRGFRTYMHPVIVVDGTHLKGRFRGAMFVATTHDENEHVYPIAFGYDSENNL